MKQQVLLVVGADMCGKSNIIAELSKRLNIPSFKASNEHQNFLHDPDRFINELRFSDFRTVDLLKQTSQSIIIDRCYPCEWVYSRFFCRQTDIIALRKLDKLYAELGTKILVCSRRSFEGINDDLDPNRLNSAGLQQISNLYNDFMSWTRCESKLLWVDDEDLDRETNDVIKWLDGSSKRREADYHCII